MQASSALSTCALAARLEFFQMESCVQLEHGETAPNVWVAVTVISDSVSPGNARAAGVCVLGGSLGQSGSLSIREYRCAVCVSGIQTSPKNEMVVPRVQKAFLNYFPIPQNLSSA